MGGAIYLADHLEWAPRFEGTLMFHVLRNAPRLGSVWPSMVASLHDNNTLEAKFIADQPLWFTGIYKNEKKVQELWESWQAAL